MDGYYYLHDNGELIYKPHADICDLRDSDLVVMFWPLDISNRASAWKFLVEALCIGGKSDTTKNRIKELAEKWRCDNEDAKNYAKYLKLVLEMDGDQFCAHREDFTNLQESPVGFGNTALEAFADLCKNFDFHYTKLNWHDDFEKLCTK